MHDSVAGIADPASQQCARCGPGGAMNSEQRYLLDLQGYLHIRGALAADELGAAQRAGLPGAGEPLLDRADPRGGRRPLPRHG